MVQAMSLTPKMKSWKTFSMYSLWAEGHFLTISYVLKPLMLEAAKSILSDMVCRQQRLRMVVPLGMVAPGYGCPRYGCPPIWLPRLRSIHTKRVDASVRALLIGYTHCQGAFARKSTWKVPSSEAKFSSRLLHRISMLLMSLGRFDFFCLNIFRFMLFGCRKITPFLRCFFLASVEN